MVKEFIEIKPYKQGDEKGINNLFNKIFKKVRTIEEWNWKFRDNPFNNDLAEWIVLAETEGAIIGHYSSLATEMKYGDNVVKAAQPVDTMIDPSAKFGMKLIRKLYDLHIKYIDITALFGFGFPNETAYELGKRFLEYKDLGEMIQLFKRLGLRGAFKRRLKWCPDRIINLFHNLSKVFYGFTILTKSSNKDIVVRTVDKFDERIERFWNSVKDRYGIMTVRSLPYLQWRYKDKRYKILIGEKNDELVGYAVTKVENCGDARVGYIMDVFTIADKIAAVLAGVLEFFIEQDVDYVLCGLLRLDPLCACLKRIGFKEHKGIKPIHVVVTPLTNEVDIGYLLNQENWHLTYGDTDGF